MNVLWPNVTHEQELAHRTRNMSFARAAELELLARNGIPDGVELSAHEQGVVDCHRRIIAH